MIVSLNPLHEPREGSVLRRIAYAHPVFDSAAIAAQGRLASLQGLSHVWFCGAWTGYGFHEDGLKSGQQVADQILARQDLSSGMPLATTGADAPALLEAA